MKKILIIICFAITIFASDYKDSNYPNDLKEALEIVEQNKYVINSKPSSNDEFCSEMFEDFKSGNGFEFIEPDIQTNDYNNSALVDATRECREKYPYINIEMEYPVLYLQKHIYTSDRYSKFARENAYISHWGYRWYELDFDDNSSNGKENLFYQSGYNLMIKNKKRDYENYYEYDNYFLSNKNQCEGILSLQIHSLYTKKINEKTRNLNGVVRYKNKYYIYDFKYYSTGYYGFDIYLRGWSNIVNVKRKMTSISSICKYKQLKQTRKK